MPKYSLKKMAKKEPVSKMDSELMKKVSHFKSLASQKEERHADSAPIAGVRG